MGWMLRISMNGMDAEDFDECRWMGWMLRISMDGDECSWMGWMGWMPGGSDEMQMNSR